MKKTRRDEPTTLLRVTVKAHRALKVEAAQKGVRMLELASQKLLAPLSAA